MKKKLIQIYYDMRTQPVVAWVTILGTALSIFLIMTVLMMQQVKIIPFAPESNRDRMLYGMFFHLESNEEGAGSGSANLSYNMARRLYGDLDGVAEVSYFDKDPSHNDLKGPSGKKFTGAIRFADDAFWRIYDHTLLSGRFFTADEVAAKSRVAVLSESTARRLFNDASPLGGHFQQNHADYEVIGVVADVSPLASMAYGEVYVPVDRDVIWEMNGLQVFGPFTAAMLLEPDTDKEAVRGQVLARYREVDSELNAEGYRTVYHESPFSQEVIASGVAGSNVTPDVSGGRTLRYVLYAILLIVPAINLSTMLHSRLRRRVSELGVRRAFGCTRRRIISDIISENLIVTVIGGVIGLAAGIIFARCYDGLYTNSGGEAVRPALGLLLDWRILLSAFAACFILNIISASVPAWQASRLRPVEAINAK